mgnify:CR=1 FL=1
MWIADRWKDYEVLDCSGGEKLERWGDFLLIRPDPQVIWDTPKTEKGWRKMNGHYHRSAKGGGEWEFFDPFFKILFVPNGFRKNDYHRKQRLRDGIFRNGHLFLF